MHKYQLFNSSVARFPLGKTNGFIGPGTYEMGSKKDQLGVKKNNTQKVGINIPFNSESIRDYELNRS